MLTLPESPISSTNSAVPKMVLETKAQELKSFARDMPLIENCMREQATRIRQLEAAEKDYVQILRKRQMEITSLITKLEESRHKQAQAEARLADALSATEGQHTQEEIQKVDRNTNEKGDVDKGDGKICQNEGEDDQNTNEKDDVDKGNRKVCQNEGEDDQNTNEKDDVDKGNGKVCQNEGEDDQTTNEKDDVDKGNGKVCQNEGGLDPPDEEQWTIFEIEDDNISRLLASKKGGQTIHGQMPDKKDMSFKAGAAKKRDEERRKARKSWRQSFLQLVGLKPEKRKAECEGKFEEMRPSKRQNLSKTPFTHQQDKPDINENIKESKNPTQQVGKKESKRKLEIEQNGEAPRRSKRLCQRFNQSSPLISKGISKVPQPVKMRKGRPRKTKQTEAPNDLAKEDKLKQNKVEADAISTRLRSRSRKA